MSNWKRELRRLGRLALLLAIRLTPLPRRAKAWLIWMGGPKVLFAASALVEDSEGRVLVLRSLHSGDWQFPGGCVERGEAVSTALRRECREELGLDVESAKLTGIYVDLLGLSQCALFRCRLAAGPIRLSEEHTAFRYARPEELAPHLQKAVLDAREVGPS